MYTQYVNIITVQSKPTCPNCHPFMNLEKQPRF